jgi:hypothetical protein
MVEESKIQQILDKINIITNTLTMHIGIQDTHDIIRDKQISEMYKIMVTGNGDVAIPETVRKHAEWIKEHDKEKEENYRENKEVLRINIADEKKEKSDYRVSKRQFFIMVAAQVIGFIIIGIELALNMR